VLAHYELAQPVRCRLQARGLNDTYKVEAGETVYFMRVYRAGWRSRDEIETELAMLRHLARCGANVSIPLWRRDRQMSATLACAEGERTAVLFTAAPGHEVDYKAFTEEQAGRYGKAAATIHAAAASFTGPRLRPPLDLAALLERPAALVGAALAHRDDDRGYVAALATRLRDDIEAASGLETGFCHGDFHGQNSCWSGGRFTFYDFDC
jgi:Ser/Thr protein kinase RdoA (MazF antagonist)